MGQISLFNPKKIVNVSRVPQRSPFRYPGGKTWLVPWLRQWLSSLLVKPNEFVEPFVGGGSISLTVAFENYAEHVTMAELDDQIASVWKTILSEDREWLAKRIASFNLSYENAAKVIKRKPKSVRDKGFQTLLKNRIYHGGILAAGSGMLKNGENGKGIHSRWYPETLKKRILNIGEVADKMSFIEGDGIEILRRYADREDAVFFIDPPYTAGGKKAGRRLYTFNELDHKELFRVTQTLKGDFLMTYDNADEVRKMANEHGFDTCIVPMKGTHHIPKMELLIGRDLSWVKKKPNSGTQ